MRLNRYEKETVILWNAAEDTASIYTADPETSQGIRICLPLVCSVCAV